MISRDTVWQSKHESARCVAFSSAMVQSIARVQVLFSGSRSSKPKLHGIFIASVMLFSKMPFKLGSGVVESSRVPSDHRESTLIEAEICEALAC